MRRPIASLVLASILAIGGFLTACAESDLTTCGDGLRDRAFACIEQKR